MAIKSEYKFVRFLSAIVFIGLLVAAFGFGFIFGKRVSSLPERIYQMPQDHPNLVQWRADWREAPNDIVTATVLASDATSLYVYIDYLYSGEYGAEVLTCGGLKIVGKRVAWSSCSPVAIHSGRGFAVLRLQMGSKGEKVEFTDGIYITMYTSGGRTFYEKSIPFKKLWLRDQPQFITYIEQALGW